MRPSPSWQTSCRILVLLCEFSSGPLGGWASGEDTTSLGRRLDLEAARIVIPTGASAREKNAVRMLVEEVEKRTQVHWSASDTWPEGPGPRIVVGSITALNAFEGPHRRALEAFDSQAEGYRIRVLPNGPVVVVAGSDERGVLFGVGRLLRELRMGSGRAQLPAGLEVDAAPRYPLRGHQLGYRPKTNSYDGWDLALWEQYLRDLVVFGTNAIELIPPRSDDDADSPHFPLPPGEMLSGMSRLADRYGLDVWIWYPAMDADYADRKTVEFALREWSEVFRRLPRLDAVFVPGGDPGHTRPKVLFALLEKQVEVLHRIHPRAQMWVSPQGFNREWLEEFLELLKSEPTWLSGIVFGPQIRIGLPELRAAVPRRYPIRHYPDITHSLQCQYPVPDWDLAFALTEEREVINPRPRGQASIFRTLRAHTNGFLTYSEGCNDDVNKFLWSGLGWDPDADVAAILREYSRYFLGDRYTDSFAQGLLALEHNWEGPLLTNGSVEVTLRQFQDMERSASPVDLRNWRFQQALYRAYYDAYTRDRLLHERGVESRARSELRRAPEIGSLAAMDRASAILARSLDRVSADRRARVFELAEALFQSIRMQLSVPRYAAISQDRGATLDAIDVPLNDRVWLEQQFGQLRSLSSEPERQRGLEALLNRTDPGPGGFYDSLGDLAHQPHLVRGPGFSSDPAFLRSSLVGFGRHDGWPLAWCKNAQSLNDAPLQLHYDDLDRTATYRVRVVYAGDSFRTRIRLVADDVEVHPLMKKPVPVKALEFDLSPETTNDGSLTLSWTRDAGLGGNGRGCEVSEVWLIRKEASPVPGR
jgi:hypothetical protein